MAQYPPECYCGNVEYLELGMLGDLTHWRCRDCGLQTSTDGDPTEAEMRGVYHNIPPEYTEA